MMTANEDTGCFGITGASRQVKQRPKSTDEHKNLQKTTEVKKRPIFGMNP